MFTGIIEGIGEVVAAEPEAEGVRLTFALPRAIEHLVVGGSLAVDGVCLTVVALGPGRATCQAIAETLRRSTLGRLRPGSRVNLERPLAVGGRLEGHWVQGHVDGRARFDARTLEGASERLSFELLDRDLGRYVVSKGSIAIAGVSLTVGDARRDAFAVYLIPHTLAVTTLGDLHPGDEVNIEIDILAKYLEHLIGLDGESGRDARKSGVDLATFLKSGQGAWRERSS